MSIIINDMKMPKGCLECPFKEIGMSTMTQCQLIAGWVEYAKDGYERPTECPLEEQKKGKWIKRGKIFQCSECEKFSITQDNYCSNCGAEMEKTDV